MSDTTAPQAGGEKRALGDDHSDSSAQRSDPEKHALADKNNFDSEKHVVGDADASVKSIIEERAAQDGVTPVFLAKVQVLNQAIAECGTGWYQYALFISAGFGWFADNIWLQAIAIVMPAVANESNFPDYPYIRMATLALYAGLIVGAAFWGITADLIGRRLAWNATLIIGAIFAFPAGAAPNFPVFGLFLALIGFGVGGNLPVDGALFLEFLPGESQWLLTLLSVWWAVGQVVASLIAWPFIAKYSCDATRLANDPVYVCDWSNNAGWRYTYFTLGALMLFLALIRVVILPMEESPKFLMSIGKDEEAVAVVQKIAKMNGKTTTLTVERLRQAAAPWADGSPDAATTKFSVMERIKHSMSDLRGEHIRAIFSTRRLAFSSSLIILIYGLLGMCYPLFYAFLGTYLSERNAQSGDTSVDATYGPYAYQAACGVIGSFLAVLLIQWKRGGRKFAMAFFTVISGVFLLILTAVKGNKKVNAFTCLASLTTNAMYGIVYGYAPELFPTTSRGTGDALCAAASRVTGIFAPVIAVYGNTSPNGPVYVSGAMFVGTGLLMLLLPIETYGQTAI